MNINRDDFIQQLDKIFESQLKNILSDEEKLNYNLSKQIKENDVFVISKTSIDINDNNFLTKINLKNKKKLQTALSESGKSIVVIYNDRKTPIMVSGEWDSADTSYFTISESKYIKVCKNEKYGIIDCEKNIIIKPIYEDIDKCSVCGKYIWVKPYNPTIQDTDYGYGLIDIKENKKTPFNFFFSGKKFLNFNKTELLFCKSIIGECVYDITNQIYMIDDKKFNKISINEENQLFIVKKDNKFGVYNILEPIYEHINIFNSTIQATMNKKIGLFDLKGKEIAPIIYEKIIRIEKDTITLLKDKTQETIQITR